MKPKIFTNPIEVGNRLEEAFGLKRELLLEAIEAMVTARNSCTDNDPPMAGGFKSWSDGTRRMREVCAPFGWVRNNDNFVYSVFSAERQIKIAVCNTDDGTGLENREPQNRNKKGAATDRAVSNNQMSLFADLGDNVIQLEPDAEGIRYWYLCAYIEGENLRAELSCPSECEGGFFKSFVERIILIGETGDDDGVRVRRESPDGSPDIDINVTRKQA